MNKVQGQVQGFDKYRLSCWIHWWSQRESNPRLATILPSLKPSKTFINLDNRRVFNSSKRIRAPDKYP